MHTVIAFVNGVMIYQKKVDDPDKLKND